jgi:N-acetylglucosaminyldiphosphoundecaprenol N-acetyl-beta-D-mannosaminyltransferase
MTTRQETAECAERVSVLGIPVDRVTMDEVVEAIGRYVEEGGTHIVVTADAGGIVCAQRDETFRRIVLAADLVTPDSEGVLWACNRQGKPMRERVSGVDLVDRLCALSAKTGMRLFFLGAGPGVAEIAAEKLRLKHPGCNIVGTRHGFFPADSDEIVAQEIAGSKPDVLFVAMGIPRQEKFIDATREIVGAAVSIGVGGSFDVFSGKAKRAPMFVRRMRLEWLWRLVLNPRKISKVKALPVFAWLVLRSK